jgi:transglutaminase-like putative cysteine protease
MESENYPPEHAGYGQPTWFLDSDSAEVVRFAAAAVGQAAGEVERAVRLFYAVRDGIRYDPYSFRLDPPESFRSSAILGHEKDFCIPKAILLVSAARASGIPSRLGFADVRNHLTSRRLRELMRGDLFVYHGFAELHLEGRWLKATPAFDQGLCERFGVRPLEFDGREDALFHPFDALGRRHMEYVRYHGTFADFPHQEMAAAMRAAYPQFFGTEPTPASGDFAQEADEERTDPSAPGRG